MTPILQIKRHGVRATIILNRPTSHNALSRKLITQIKEAFFDLQQERNVRAIILTGSGSSFCSGADLAEIGDSMQMEEPFGQWRADAVAYRELLETVLRCPKPVIAAVNGPALGAGAALALACDIVLGSPSAQFGFPEPRRGVVSGVAMPLLAFRIGGGRAGYLLLSGQTIDAEQAHQWGILHELVKDTVLWARGSEIAEHISQAAQEAIQLTKRTLNETVGESMLSMLAAGAAASATSRTTDAASEGIAAFNQKRDPDWP